MFQLFVGSLNTFKLMSVVSRQVSGMSFVGCRIETSGMDLVFEETVKDLALKFNSDLTFDQKAKYLIDGMEKAHGFSWACVVESYKTFVQNMAVSKRPDQYIRMICNSDRIRLWRLNDPPQ